MSSPQNNFFYAVCVQPEMEARSLYEIDLGPDNPVNVRLRKISGSVGSAVRPGNVISGGNHIVFDDQLFLQLGERDTQGRWKQNARSLGRTSYVAGLFLLQSDAVGAYEANDLKPHDLRWHKHTLDVWKYFNGHRRCVFVG